MLAGFHLRQAHTKAGVNAARQRGAVCAFHGHAWRSCLHLPGHGYGEYLNLFLNYFPLLHLSGVELE